MKRFVWIGWGALAACAGEHKVLDDTGTDDRGEEAAETTDEAPPVEITAVAEIALLGQVEDTLSNAIVSFHDDPQQTPTTSEPSPRCVSNSAPAEPETDPAPPQPPVPRDGGEVTLAFDGQEVPLDVEGFERIGDLDPWPAMQRLSLSAAGGEVPDFDAPDLFAVPPKVAGTLADDPDGSATVTWIPSDIGATSIVLFLTGTDDGMTCEGPDDGSFTISADDMRAIGTLRSALVARVHALTQDVGEIRVETTILTAAAL